MRDSDNQPSNPGPVANIAKGVLVSAGLTALVMALVYVGKVVSEHDRAEQNTHVLHADENWPVPAQAVYDQAQYEQGQPLTLSTQCPPSFEKQQGRCVLVNMYQQYTSVQNRGVGGTQTSLPAHRDGFTPEQIDLGRFLFFDPLLSGNGELSCASCHHPELGMADGRDRSIGALGTRVGRSSPTLWNSAFLTSFFWDARADSLEEQALGPLYAEEEMGNTPAQLLSSLIENESYPVLFKQAFPESTGIDLEQVYTALTAFQTSLISLNSRYDQYAHGYHDALTDNEVAGMNVFRSFVARCSECHQPPLFTNNQVAVIGVPEPEGLPFDVGAEKTFNAAKLKGGFKVPSLRNITRTAPYMHSGGMEDLREAVEFYTKGRGHAVPDGVDMQLHWHIWEPDLTDDEIDRIVDFLGALTDESFKPRIPASVPSGLTPIGQLPEALQQQEITRVKSTRDPKNETHTMTSTEG
jgi:cytochrome c peroxidase